jgi:hypothetical protein
MSDLWTYASADHEAEALERQFVTAKVIASTQGRYLTASISENEYQSRLALVQDDIDQAVIASVGEDADYETYTAVKDRVEAAFKSDWNNLRTAAEWEAGGTWDDVPWMAAVPGVHGRYEVRGLGDSSGVDQKFTDDLDEAKRLVEQSGFGSITDHDQGKVLRYASKTAAESRSINAIADEIYGDWKNVNYAAKPYLEAMMHLNSMSDKYYEDSAKSVVTYFLSNATTWRGETAQALKAELKSMVKSASKTAGEVPPEFKAQQDGTDGDSEAKKTDGDSKADDDGDNESSEQAKEEDTTADKESLPEKDDPETTSKDEDDDGASKPPWLDSKNSSIATAVDREWTPGKDMKLCPTCKGSLGHDDCPICKGKGWIKDDSTKESKVAVAPPADEETGEWEASDVNNVSDPQGQPIEGNDDEWPLDADSKSASLFPSLDKSAALLKKIAEENPFMHAGPGNPNSSASPASPMPKEPSGGRVPGTGSGTVNQPMTSGPESKPWETNTSPDMGISSAPDSLAGGTGKDGGTNMLSNSSKKEAAILRITAGVIATNTGIDPQMARKVAIETVERFPGVAGA